MKKKTIAIGTSDFKEIIEGNHYFVDKSLLLSEFLEDGAKVTLLSRPRRWGKTLSMSMFKYFLEKTAISYKYLFKGLAVEKYQNIMDQQGVYPIIFISFKEAKKNNWDDCYEVLQAVIIQEYKKHSYILQSDLFDEKEKNEYQAILSKAASKIDYERSLYLLSLFLHRYHDKAPIILLDEYDAPIHTGFMHDFYQEVVDFMRSFLSSALKDNVHLKKGFLTGILRVSKESIFSGLNNLKVCTLLDEQYSEFFGFSESEVKAILIYYGGHENDEKIKAWYNGYRMGISHTMYNPWSVLNYIDKNRELGSYWMGSSDNLLIKEIIQRLPTLFMQDLELLMLGQTIKKRMMDFVTFDDLFKHTDIACNFLLSTGYLSFEKKYMEGNKQYISFVIPNEEVKLFYEDVVTAWIEEHVRLSTYQNMIKDLVSGDIEMFKETFVEIVEDSMSHFDISGKEPESFYHAFVLGMLINLSQTHEVKSNRESGLGRYDVMIIPKNMSKVGIIFEFKKSRNITDEGLEAAAQQALQQIEKRNYKAELRSRGIKRIINIAIAFAGKKVLIKDQEE